MTNEHEKFHGRTQAEKDLWELLGEGRIQTKGAVPSVWPQVQQRTFGSPEKNLQAGNSWFFGGGQWVRASLAASAVAAGLMVGILIPGFSGQAGADETNSDLWVSEASWLDVTATDGLAGIWLDPGLSDESDGS